MPYYPWKDERTGKELEVLRNFSSYEEPPTEEEAVEAGFSAKEYTLATWKRLIGSKIRTARGANWGPGKGNW